MSLAVYTFDELLAPIPGPNPAGSSLRYSLVMDEIREARRSDDPDFPPPSGEPKTANWESVVRLTSRAIAEQSKDLQLAAWFTEAKSRTEGFAGLEGGLSLICELIQRYWDSGLHPIDDDGDDEFRAGVAEWLSRKLPALILEIPLTISGKPPCSLSDLQRAGTESANASRTALQAFHGTLARESVGNLRLMLRILGNASRVLKDLADLFDNKFGVEFSGFREAEVALSECADVVERQVQESKLRQEGSAPPPATESSVSVPPPLPTPNLETIAQFTSPVMSDGSARARFLEKLDLAENALEDKRARPAVAIFEDLAAQIERFHLEEWEAPNLVGRVWKGLCRCHAGAMQGSPEAARRVQAYERLCRVDPRSALTLDESE